MSAARDFGIVPGDKVLITTDAWFYGPDGRTYRGVCGTVKGVYSDTDTLGIKTNARSANWFVEVGDTTIAGCQIHYVIKVDECNTGDVEDYSTESGATVHFSRPSHIHDADKRKPTYSFKRIEQA